MIFRDEGGQPRSIDLFRFNRGKIISINRNLPRPIRMNSCIGFGSNSEKKSNFASMMK